MSNIRSQFTQRITLTSIYDTPRMFANVPVAFTSINQRLYLTMEQICGLIGLTSKPVRFHMETVFVEDIQLFNGGGIPCPHHYLTHYEAPVLYSRTNSGVGGGGGTKLTKFYDLELVIRIVERTQNTERKAEILGWMRNVIVEFVQHGFVVDPYAVQADPNVLHALTERVDAYNFSQERLDMVEENKHLVWMFYRCTGIHLTDETVNPAVFSYFMRCCHNTAHIATHGMTALQIRAARGNPNQLDFGQHNYRGKVAPRTDELANACNFLTNNELFTRTSIIRVAVGRIMMYMDTHGPIPFKQALKMFTMHCVSQYIPYVSWDWRDYADTALDNIVSMGGSGTLRAEIRRAIHVYLENFPNRHTLTQDQTVVYQQAVQELVNASLEL